MGAFSHRPPGDTTDRPSPEPGLETLLGNTRGQLATTFLARPLITPEAVMDPGKGLPPVIVDCRFDLASASAGGSRYADGHIAGARYLHLERDLSDRSARAPPAATLSEADAQITLADIGVDADGPVVFYDDAGGPFAARAWWLACWWAIPAPTS